MTCLCDWAADSAPRFGDHHRQTKCLPFVSRASTTNLIPSTHKMINYNLKQHIRAQKASAKIYEQLFIFFLSLSRPLAINLPLSLSRATAAAAARSQIHFSQILMGKCRNRSKTPYTNDIMYFCHPSNTQHHPHSFETEYPKNIILSFPSQPHHSLWI